LKLRWAHSFLLSAVGAISSCVLGGCGSNNTSSQLTLVQLRKAYAVEEIVLNRRVHECMKRSGFEYVKPNQGTPRFLGLIGLDPENRRRLTAEFGYGVAMQYFEKPVSKDSVRAGFFEKQIQCENSARQELPLYKFRHERQSSFDDSMFDRYRSAEWRAADRLWSSCMRRAGFEVEHSLTAWQVFKDRAEMLPGGSIRNTLLARIRTDEIDAAKVDHKCRVEFLDRIDLRYKEKVAKTVFFSDLPASTEQAIRRYLDLK
jgi:hypothetical protein